MPSDSGAVSEGVRLVMRSYLSTHHLYAARFAAEGAAPLETEPEIRMKDFIRHRGYVLAAITESVSFLEAAVNEIYKDCADGHHSYVLPLGEDCIARLKTLWESTNGGDRLDLLGKYNMALSMANAQLLDEGATPFQEVALVRRLRNYVVHYKPHDVATDESTKLGDQLAHRGIAGHPLFAGNPWFPDRALSAGCAAWCWRSARAFTNEFAARIGLSLNYQLADFDDPLPE